MRDYAELVKDLRYCADLDKECLKCKTFEQHDCFNKLGADAADAIEELQARNDKQTMMIRKQSERTKELLAAVPHWISVEERLPEQGERVLVSNGGFICESYLSQSGKWQRGGVDMFFMTPTHWTEMPRFEPPKEESK